MNTKGLVNDMHPLLKRYIPLADMLAATFGEDCEVVLHDLADPEHSVVYVANGQVTGRRIGQGIEHLVREVMQADGPEQDYAVNDYFHKHGRLIRSSSLFIRDEEDHLIGAMCINLDTTRITQQMAFLQSLMPKPPNLLLHMRRNTGTVSRIWSCRWWTTSWLVVM